MAAVQDSDAIKYFQTFSKIIIYLQFRIDSAIIAEGSRVLWKGEKYMPRSRQVAGGEAGGKEAG